MADDDVAFVYTAAEIGQEPGSGRITYVRPTTDMPSTEFILGSLAGDGAFPVSPACALFRLADIRQSFIMELPTEPRTDLTATGAGTDVLLYLLTAVRYPRVAHLPESLAFFRAHEGSITVRGRGGQVSLSYALSKGWFAGTHGHKLSARVILGREWVRQMRDSHRLLDPVTAATRYRHIVSPAGLVFGATAELVRRAKRRFSRV
jgi:hypothetical protein